MKNQKTLRIVSVVQLIVFLLSLWKRGAQPAFVETDTKEKLKAGSPFGKEIRKLTFAGIMIGADYENAVKKVTGDATFEAGSLPWGRWITFQGKRSPVIVHKGKFYVRASFLNAASPVRTVYVDGAGKVVSKADVAPWRMERKGEPVTVRNYTASNIRRMNVAGERLLVA